MPRLGSVTSFGAHDRGHDRVNDPGTWSAVYPHFYTPASHGWTYTDRSSRSSSSPAASRWRFRSAAGEPAEGAPTRRLRNTAVRSAVLVRDWVSFSTSSVFSPFIASASGVPGVLQRIGLCSSSAGRFAWWRRRAARLGGRGPLVGYWALLAPARSTPQDTSPRGWIARSRLPSWIARPTIPRVCCRLPAIATTLLGVFAGERLRSALRCRASRRRSSRAARPPPRRGSPGAGSFRSTRASGPRRTRCSCRARRREPRVSASRSWT